MKLDPKTISILSNFHTINQSIAIQPGSVLKTISQTDSMFAVAKVPDTFPAPLAIYDISKFLAILSLSKEHDITFADKYMLIKFPDRGNSCTKYFYANPDLIKTPPNKSVKATNPYCQFHLPWDVLSTTLKAMLILKYNEIAFIGDGKKLTLSAINSKDDESSSYSTELGDTSKVFTCIIEVEKLKLINDDYNVTISTEGVANFKGSAVEYWIVYNAKSQFGDK